MEQSRLDSHPEKGFGARGKGRLWLRRVGIAGLLLVSLVLVVVGVAGLWAHSQLRASLPRLEGELSIPGLEDRVVVSRDELGVPIVEARTSLDAACSLGFLHAQDRFFQMDLMRRQAAGELAELFGEAAVDWDRFIRVHRLRAVAEARWASTSGGDRKMLEAYAAGVNAGLQSLDASPFEYLLLREQPRSWQPEDTVLVVLAMFIELQDEDGSRESSYGVLKDLVPEPLFELLTAQGTEWDAPIVGEALLTPPIPSAEVFDLRRLSNSSTEDEGMEGIGEGGEQVPGSNNWAVAGSLSRTGSAILADDMHLGISVPNTWYRAMLRWQDPEAPGGVRWVCGVTLPGTPYVVVGSNGRIAWGFTNSYGDWLDLVEIEMLSEHGETYTTPDGPRELEHLTEIIRVHGGEDVELEVKQTIWGPLIDHDHLGRPRALRWTAHEPGAVNFRITELVAAGTVEEALEIANRTGIPPQNFVCADSAGSIGWTIIGLIPRRIGADWRLPSSWSSGEKMWQGWLDPGEYPRVVNPPSGRLWSANNRVVGGGELDIVGDGGFALGARARQIRDDLMDSDAFDEMDLLAIQLDDRAVFLGRWQELLLEVLSDEVIAGAPDRGELREHVEGWGGRAAVDSVGFRMVRTFRLELIEQVMSPLTARAKQADERFRFTDLGQREGVVWKLVCERPDHMLDPQFNSWDEALLAAADATIETFTGDGSVLEEHTWGEYNTVRIRHPLSRAIPLLARWLDMPVESLPGDSHMPRVQGPTFGASQRMVVSPGHEQNAIFHMPSGQSGHPLSPFFRAGHDAWARGEPTPFLPGETLYRLELVP